MALNAGELGKKLLSEVEEVGLKDVSEDQDHLHSPFHAIAN